MEIVILIGTGVIAVFFWVLLLLIFCNMRRVSTPSPAESLPSSSRGLSPPWLALKLRNIVPLGSLVSWEASLTPPCWALTGPEVVCPSVPSYIESP